MLDKYGISNFNCEIVANKKNGRPSYLFGKIYLNPFVNDGFGGRKLDTQLSYWQKYNFQFSHELTHHIQEIQKRGLPIHIDTRTMQQLPFPDKSFQETEATANSIWVMEQVFPEYSDYNARIREDEKYYDYDEAFRLVDTAELETIWKQHKPNTK